MTARYRNLMIRSLLPGVIFILVFMYFAVFNKYHILYLEQNQLFRFNLSYLRDFFLLPGPLSLIIGAFFTQFFVISWLGALIITLKCLAVYFFTKYILGKYNIMGLVFPFIPVWLLVILHSNELFTPDQSIGLMLSLLFTAVYISVSTPKIRYILFLSLWPLYFYLTGGFAMICVVICTLHEVLSGTRKDRFLFIALYILEGILMPWLFSQLLFFIPKGKIFTYPLFYTFHTFELVSLISVYFILPVLMVTGYFINKVNASVVKFIRGTTIKILTGSLTILLMVFVIYKFAYNKRAEQMFAIDYHIRQAEWRKALKQAEQYPDLNTLVIYYTNLALLNSGQLGEKMFDYPQIGPGGLRLKWERNSNLVFGGDIFYYLAYNNEAYRWAFEAMVAKGVNPRSLKRLIITSIVNGDNDVAEKYLHILGQAPFYRKWVLKYERLLSDPASLANDPEIKRNRNFLVNKNFISNATGMNLDNLLENHPENKMAFEYYLADLLLRKELDSFAENISRLKELGYTSIPLCFEEALIFYNFYENKQVIPEGFSFRPETVARFNEYAGLYTKFRSDRAAARYELGKKFRNTYWYYLQFANI
mgnify:CR=1 FL=1